MPRPDSSGTPDSSAATRDAVRAPDADLRTRLAGAVIAGLLYGLRVVEDEHLLNAGHDEVVRRYGRSLQELLVPTG